ncbi:MAG: glycosyltransferase [Desulfobacteraceae bacterium]|nr:glycosyltransferase [Desulfobacteraceae bacterium]
MQMHSERPVMAHLTGIYLPGTVTFIYQYITNMRRYNPVVLAASKDRPERFPFPDLYIPDLSRLQMLLVKLDRRLFHRQRLVEPFFQRTMQSRGVKLLHAHFGGIGVFALPLHFSSGLPLVTTFYGEDMSAVPRKPGWRKSYQKLFDNGALFLVEGSHMRDRLAALGCPLEKVQIQRIGVDLNRFSYRVVPPRDESVRILMCGRFVEKKGFEYGIRAFAQVLPEFPKAQLRIVGDGPLRPRLEQLIRRLGLEVGRSVVLMGYLSYDAYAEEAAQAHVFMAPSVTASNGDSEGGAPTVLLEMQARGLPILSTRHADIPEVVVDGASGYLVPERDEVTLSEKLAELLAYPERWDEMGRAGRAHIERQHDIVTLAQELEEKYDSVRAVYRQE